MEKEELDKFKLRIGSIDSTELILYWLIVNEEIKKRLKRIKEEKLK